MTELARGADTLVIQCLDVEDRMPAVTAGAMAGTLGAAEWRPRPVSGGWSWFTSGRRSTIRRGAEAMVADVATVFGGPIHFSKESDVLDLG